MRRDSVAANSRLTVIEGQPTPDGWFGKPWALWQGIRHAGGEWLLFTDADVIHRRDTLTKALDYAQSEDLPVLSLVPKVETHLFWEHVLYPVLPIFVGPRWRLDEINNPESDAGLAAGGFILSGAMPTM